MRSVPSHARLFRKSRMGWYLFSFAYNILTDRKDIIKPIGFHRESTALTDTDMKYLLLYLEETYGLTSEKKIETAIGIVANENKYHPIRDFLNSFRAS